MQPSLEPPTLVTLKMPQSHQHMVKIGRLPYLALGY